MNKRIEAADEAVFGTLMSAGITNRCIWTAANGAVYLVNGGTQTVIFSTTPDELAGMTDDELVGALWHDVQK